MRLPGPVAALLLALLPRLLPPDRLRRLRLIVRPGRLLRRHPDLLRRRWSRRSLWQTLPPRTWTAGTLQQPA